MDAPRDFYLALLERVGHSYLVDTFAQTAGTLEGSSDNKTHLAYYLKRYMEGITLQEKRAAQDKPKPGPNPGRTRQEIIDRAAQTLMLEVFRRQLGEFYQPFVRKIQGLLISPHQAEVFIPSYQEEGLPLIKLEGKGVANKPFILERSAKWIHLLRAIGFSIGLKLSTKQNKERLPSKQSYPELYRSLSRFQNQPIAWNLLLHATGRSKDHRVDLMEVKPSFMPTKRRVDRLPLLNEEVYCTARRCWVLDPAVPCSADNSGESWERVFPGDPYVSSPSITELTLRGTGENVETHPLCASFLPWVFGNLGEPFLTWLSQRGYQDDQDEQGNMVNCFPLRKAVTSSQAPRSQQIRRAVAYLTEEDEVTEGLPDDTNTLLTALSHHHKVNIWLLDADTRDYPPPTHETFPSVFLYTTGDFVEPILWVGLPGTRAPKLQGSLKAGHPITQAFQGLDELESLASESSEQSGLRKLSGVHDPDEVTEVSRKTISSYPSYNLDVGDGTVSDFRMGPAYYRDGDTSTEYRDLYSDSRPYHLQGYYTVDTESGRNSINLDSADSAGSSQLGGSSFPLYRALWQRTSEPAYTDSYTYDTSDTSNWS